MHLTPLQQRVAREIVSYARRENLAAGHHLTRLALAREIGTSHNPVEAALAHLARIGVVKHEPDRGYFLARPARELREIVERLHTAGGDPLYYRIADYRLTHRLPDVVTEAELIRLFNVSRTEVRKALLHIQQDGWGERRAGHGWVFLPLIDSPQAYEESFEIRRAIEPAAILSPKFRPDPHALASLMRQQEFMAATGYRTMSPVEWADINARFHESICAWSRNRFFLQTMRRLNQLRRLVEYKVIAGHHRAPRKAQAKQHLVILKTIESGDYPHAAALLRKHLEGAKREKVQASLFRTEPALALSIPARPAGSPRDTTTKEHP